MLQSQKTDIYFFFFESTTEYRNFTLYSYVNKEKNLTLLYYIVFFEEI